MASMSLQYVVLGKLKMHMQKNEVGPLSYTINKKNHSKWFKLNVISETVKPLEDNIQKKIPDISLGNDFLNMTSKVRVAKAK